MGKYLISTMMFLLLAGSAAISQDDIVRRVILIGDAGEMNNQQQAIVANAASRILADKTTVLYLGNNIFPKGMKLQENSEDGYSQQILQSQYQPMRSKGAA
ncbi:MAG: hypothetical protein ACHQFX_03235, partial [Chitinophagales bacterium]